jgi:hypothetical protein
MLASCIAAKLRRGSNCQRAAEAQKRGGGNCRCLKVWMSTRGRACGKGALQFINDQRGRHEGASAGSRGGPAASGKRARLIGRAF